MSWEVCIPSKHGVEGKIHIAVDKISDTYDIDSHRNVLVNWLEKKYSGHLQQTDVIKNFTDSYEGKYRFTKIAGDVEIVINTLGYEVFTWVFIYYQDSLSKSEAIHTLYNSLMHGFYQRQGQVFETSYFRQPLAISSSDLLGSWFYGNTHRITYQSPGYAPDIVYESTKSIDNAGINYTFFENQKYRLTYRSKSTSEFGSMEMSFIEIGSFVLHGSEISFSPEQLVGFSAINGDRRSYKYTSKVLSKRKGEIVKVGAQKIKIKEPCSVLMTETWCTASKLYFVEYQRPK